MTSQRLLYGLSISILIWKLWNLGRFICFHSEKTRLSIPRLQQLTTYRASCNRFLIPTATFAQFLVIKFCHRTLSQALRINTCHHTFFSRSVIMLRLHLHLPTQRGLLPPCSVIIMHTHMHLSVTLYVLPVGRFRFRFLAEKKFSSPP